MAIVSLTRKYKDLDLAFGRHPQTGDVLKKSDLESIRQSLRNLLFTIPGERPFQPYLGTPIYRMLFEPMDPILMTALDQTIEHTIQNYEPRINLLGIQIIPHYDDNNVDVSISFQIKNTGERGSLSITLTRLR